MPTPEALADTSSADLRSYLSDWLTTRFIQGSTYISDSDFLDINFLDDGVTDFVAGETLTVKDGPPVLYGYVSAVIDYGALGTGGLVRINAKQLAVYLKTNP